MKKLSVVFYLKKDKTNSNGDCAIYCRLRVNSTQTTMFTKYWVNPDRWKQSKHLSITRNSMERSLKGELLSIGGQFQSLYRSNEQKGLILSASTLKDMYEGKEFHSEREFTLLDLFELHFKSFEDKVKVGQRSKQSLTKYHTVNKHLKSFLKEKMRADDFNLSHLSFDFIEKFDNYLRSTAQCCNNTTVKYIQFLRSVINTGIKHDKLQKDPFSKYDGKLQEVKTNFLTMEQIKRIAEKQFVSERLSMVRDTFLLSVYTGLAPVDVSKLTWANLEKDDNGQLWLRTSRTKTKTPVNVPVLPPVMKIVERYKAHPRCLHTGQLVPYSSNQTLNQYLKEIGDACQIPFDLHFYVARHSFATSVTLQNGVSMESVSKMLGHRRITQTQTYARILNEKVGKEMSELAKVLSD